MNLEQIVDHFYTAIINKADIQSNNDMRLIFLISKVHTEKELKEFIKVNINRLNIKFSNIETDAIAGCSYDITKDPDGDPSFFDWLGDLFGISNDDDGEEDGSDDGEGEAPGTGGYWGVGSATAKDMWDATNE